MSGGDDYAVKVWDLSTGHCLATLHGHNACVNSVVFSSDGLYITSVDDLGMRRTWTAPHDFPLALNTSEHPLLPAAPIFRFDQESGWILGQQTVEETPQQLFWLIPQCQPQGHIWTGGYKVMFKTKHGHWQVLDFKGHDWLAKAPIVEVIHG